MNKGGGRGGHSDHSCKCKFSDRNSQEFKNRNNMGKIYFGAFNMV